MNCWQLIYINQCGPLGIYVKVSYNLDVRCCYSAFWCFRDEAVNLHLLDVTFDIHSDAFVLPSWFLDSLWPVKSSFHVCCIFFYWLFKANLCRVVHCYSWETLSEIRLCSSTISLVQQIFTECLLCVRHRA